MKYHSLIALILILGSSCQKAGLNQLGADNQDQKETAQEKSKDIIIYPVDAQTGMANWLRNSSAKIELLREYLPRLAKYSDEINAISNEYETATQAPKDNNTTDGVNDEVRFNLLAPSNNSGVEIQKRLQDKLASAGKYINETGFKLAQLDNANEGLAFVSPSEYASVAEAQSQYMQAQGQAAQAQANAQLTLSQAWQTYAKNGNLPAEWAAANKKAQILAQREAIQNIGYALDNQSKSLDNVEKYIENEKRKVELLLEILYAHGYADYIKTFFAYSRAMRKIYFQKLRAMQWFGQALRHFKDANRQVLICKSKSEKIYQRKSEIGAHENRSKDIYFNDLSLHMNRFAASPHGEACVHKVFLAHKPIDTSELWNLRYKVTNTVTGEAAKVMCPSSDTMPQAGPLGYPHPIIENGKIAGFMRPVTYYQLYRVLTNRFFEVELAPPPTVDVPDPACMGESDSQAEQSDTSGLNAQGLLNQARYKELSDEFETDLAEDNKFATAKIDGVVIKDYGYSPQYSSIPGNETHSYGRLLVRLEDLYNRVQSCIDFGEADAPLDPNAVNVDDNEVEPTGTPWDIEAGVKTDFNLYYDSNYPESSEAIRSCMKQAELSRYMGFEILKQSERMSDILDKAANMPPPKSPNPILDKPVTSGNAPNPGNY